MRASLLSCSFVHWPHDGRRCNKLIQKVNDKSHPYVALGLAVVLVLFVLLC